MAVHFAIIGLSLQSMFYHERFVTTIYLLLLCVFKVIIIVEFSSVILTAI